MSGTHLINNTLSNKFQTAKDPSEVGNLSMIVMRYGNLAKIDKYDIPNSVIIADFSYNNVRYVSHKLLRSHWNLKVIAGLIWNMFSKEK